MAYETCEECGSSVGVYGWVRPALSSVFPLALCPRCCELMYARAFVERVNARAEARMQAGNPLEGSHYFSMQAELKAMEARAGVDAEERAEDD